MTQDTTTPTVTQADRDGAANLYNAQLGDPWFVGQLRDGRQDTGAWVQAFARHRLAHTDAGVARYREALIEIVAGNFNCSAHQRFMAAQGVAARALNGGDHDQAG